MAERNRPVEKIVKQRPEGVAYHTGQVCRHKRYNYVCVVTSWDEECQASRAWIQQMGVDRLQHRQHQPFYNVLVSDGSNRYAAQVKLHSSSIKLSFPPPAGELAADATRAGESRGDRPLLLSVRPPARLHRQHRAAAGLSRGLIASLGLQLNIVSRSSIGLRRIALCPYDVSEVY